VDQVILVTGASAGIGRACADRLADPGKAPGRVVVGASRRGTSSGSWSSLVMDVDRDDSVTEGVAAVLADHGRIDAVVACAGWGLAGPVEHTPIAEAKAQLETNFWGTVRLVQAVLGSMRTQGGGRIVLMSSIGGVVAIPFQAFYSASKFALEGYAEALAYEVAPFGVQVTLVEPGNVRSEFTARRRTVGVGGPDDTTSSGDDGEDPYARAVQRAIGVMEADEADGVSADVVARVVERVLERRRPPRHVSVGKWDERVGIMARRLLPYRVFEQAAKGSLGV